MRIPKNRPHTIMYYCKSCRRAYQLYYNYNKKMSTHEYYPPWIFGDEDRICPKCERKMKEKEKE